jgi:hypothetical protein
MHLNHMPGNRVADDGWPVIRVTSSGRSPGCVDFTDGRWLEELPRFSVQNPMLTSGILATLVPFAAK